MERLLFHAGCQIGTPGIESDAGRREEPAEGYFEPLPQFAYLHPEPQVQAGPHVQVGATIAGWQPQAQALPEQVSQVQGFRFASFTGVSTDSRSHLMKIVPLVLRARTSFPPPLTF